MLKDSKVAAFVPYVLRHTALTRLGKATNGDVFALVKIAGHSSITITQRYVHTQTDTIEGIFNRAIQAQSDAAKATAKGAKRLGGGHKIGHSQDGDQSVATSEYGVTLLFSWCREGGSNPHDLAIGGF